MLCNFTPVRLGRQFCQLFLTGSSLQNGIDGNFRRQASQYRVTEITRIFSIRRMRTPAELIGAAVGNRPMQPLHIISTLNEPIHQIIKQRLIAGRIGLIQIIRWIDNTDIEIVSPDPVHKCFGKIVIRFVQHPLHQQLSWIIALTDINFLSPQQFGNLFFSFGRFNINLAPGD